MTPASVAVRVQDMLTNGDPLEALEPVASAAVALQSYIREVGHSDQLSEDQIGNIVAWSESIVRSITRIVSMRNQTALTAAEIVFV